MSRHNTAQSEYRYRRRFLGALALVIALVIALVRWWPAPTPSSFDGPFDERAPERIQTKEIQPTTQSQDLAPPPPAPLPPVVVPNDVPVEEKIEFGESNLAVTDPADDARLQEGTADEPTAARQPDTNPRLFRAVQPQYPSAAQKDGIRARIQVAVDVSKSGRVKEAVILKRWRLSAEGRASPVGHLEHGLEQAALVAAQESRFRPAQKNGSPVASRTTITFEFGTSEN